MPKPLIVARYFSKEQADIEACMADLEGITATLAELEEEHGGEDGFLGALEKINKAEVNTRLKELRPGNAKPQLGANKKKAAELGLSAPSEDAEAALDQLAYKKYPKLTEPEIQTLVVDDK